MDFRLSNSRLRDFESLCPMEFKSKYITKEYPEFVPTMPMELGNMFETQAIGGGINGAVTINNSIYGDKIAKSEYYPRVVAQAEACKVYLKTIGGKILSRQEYISVQLTSNDGNQVMTIEGTLDVRYQWIDGKMVVIDLKFTADTENEYGDKFTWGALEKMDMSQIIHYVLLVKLKYELDYIPDGYYWVFDHKKEMKQKLIKVTVSEYALHMHIDRLFEAWNKIQLSLAMDDWEAHNTWDNCRNCKAKCRYERIMPEFTLIDL